MSTATQPITGTFAADPVHSSFQFAVKHMKVATFRAGFDEVDARLVAGDDGIALEGRAKVDSVSVHEPARAARAPRQQHRLLRRRQPPGDRLLLRPTSSSPSDGTATVQGELTIKGITKPVTATGTYQEPVQDPYGGVRSALELTATLDRREWDLNWQAPLPSGDDVLAWDVTLSVNLELVQQEA